MGTEAGDVDGHHHHHRPRASSASARHLHGVGGSSAAEVNLSARRPFAEKVWSDLAETFLPDDPFRGFGALPPARRACGALKYFVPALDWAPRYGLAKFKYDLLAGVTIASLAIPQGISYARLANLPPIIGLLNVVMSVCIMLVLLFLAPLFKYTPLVALSSIIVVAMIGLVKVKEFCHLYKVDKFDFCICMVAFLGVVFFTMVTGLSASVGLSVVRALLYVARPTTCKLGNIAGSETFRDVKQYPQAKSIPGILVLQLGSPIYFVNAGYLRERILRWVEDEENLCKSVGHDLQYVILDLGGVTSVDNSGVGMLLEVHKSLERRGITIALTNPRLEVTEKLVLSGYVRDIIGDEWVFLTVKDAITACRYALQMSRSKGEDEV